MQVFKCALGVIAAGMLFSCNSVDFKKTKGGMPYKLFAGKGGQKIENGNILKVQVVQMLNDSVLFTTYDKAPIYFPASANTQSYDISEVIPTMKEGDSVYAVQLIDTFMARNPGQIPPNFKKGDKIITTLKILKVFKTPQEVQADEDKERNARLGKEDVEVRNYLSKNNIQAQKSGGAYVQVIQQGTGAQVDSGKYVALKYTGTSFSGKTFDSNVDPKFGHTDPLGFVVGSGNMIRGFDDGVRILKQGAKAKLFVPSSLAYGAQPPSPDIKPFEHLIFDIEVMQVSDKAPAQPQMPGAPGAPGGPGASAVPPGHGPNDGHNH